MLIILHSRNKKYNILQSCTLLKCETIPKRYIECGDGR